MIGTDHCKYEDHQKNKNPFWSGIYFAKNCFPGSFFIDNLSGFFLIRTSIVKKKIFKKIFDGYGEYFIKLCFLIEKKKYSFKEIGVRYGNRKYGVSKSKFLKMFFIYSLTALKLLFNIN